MSPKCIAPWVHLFHHTDGHIYPCCRFAGDKEQALGTIAEPLEHTWHGAPARALRARFRQGIYPTTCSECFDTPVDFHRNFNQWRDFVNMELTTEEGDYPFNYRVWSITPSNLCNQKCVYCRGDYSNLIVDQFGDGKVQACFSSDQEFQAYFDRHIELIDTFVFAGGESLLQESFIKLIVKLIDSNLTDKRIYLATNLSRLKYGNYHIGEMLSHFSRATIAGSVDGYDLVNKIIRKGAQWQTIVNNRKELLNYPSVHFGVQTVITNLNALSLPAFHYQWYDEGLLGIDNIKYILLTSPREYSIRNLSRTDKQTLRERWRQYCVFLKAGTDTLFNHEPCYRKIQRLLEYAERE